MKNKSILKALAVVFILSLFLLVYQHQKPVDLQNFVTTTHQHFRYFKDNLKVRETKSLVADEKQLNLLGFTEVPRLFPQDVWRNTSLPVIVTYVRDGQESQAIGLINNLARVLVNNTLLVYDLGLGNYALKTLQNYCNSSRCQVMAFPLTEFPSHVEEENLHAFRPLIIQDALQRTGAIFFMESNYRLSRNFGHEHLSDLYEKRAKSRGVVTWPLEMKNPVSSLTHKKMFQYFRTDAENFLFLQMVNSDLLILVNTESVHKEIMLPWVQCALIQDCIVPIGAQSVGCRFDKKPHYRYSGCHNYDTSALNIVLGLKFNMDGSKYMYESTSKLFDIVDLDKANTLLRELEQNSTTEGGRFFESP